MTLNDIVQSAQGGQAIDNIAARFGLSPEQAQNAVTALLPAFQMGLQNVTAGGGIGSILQHLGNGAHQQSYADPGAAQSPEATQAGGSVLGDIFGGHAATGQVAQQASSESGVPASVIQAMMPALASVIMGGLFHGAQNGGFGGILQSMMGSVFGGSGGSIFGGQGQTTASAAPPAAEEGGLGGLIGSVLGGLFGGGNPAPTAPGATPAAPAATSSDAALDQFSSMFQAGTPASPQHEASLANILGR